MSKKIAVVGTGIMGSGIAANFLKNGYEVTVWNRTPEKTTVLEKFGAKRADTPREAIAGAGIVFEVTANDESSQAVWLDTHGILAGADASMILITSATLSVDWTKKLAILCAERELNFLDIPLTGGRVATESGTLTLLVGGNEQTLEALKSDLGAISAKIFCFGPAGSGMKYKLILNGLQAAHMVAYGEAMRLAAKVGLSADAVGPALCDRPGGAITQIAWDAYPQDIPPLTFSVDWITKDLGYAKQMGADLPTPLLDDALAIYYQAQSHGHGQDDWTIINKLG